MATGHATKLTNLGAVKIVLGVKRFMLYRVYNFVCAPRRLGGGYAYALVILLAMR